MLNRITASLVFSLGLVLAACGGQEIADTSSSSLITVTARDIQQLPPGQMYSADLSGQRTYVFDFREQPIDFSRIVLLTGSQSILMSEWLVQYKQATGEDLANQPSKQIRLGKPGEDEVTAQGCRVYRIRVPHSPDVCFLRCNGKVVVTWLCR
jgi:hypothetical protein